MPRCADGRLERTGRANGGAVRRQHSTGAEHAPRAALAIIGDELLAGKVTDVNSPFLCAELHKLGWRVTKAVVLPDSVDAIARCAPDVNSAPILRSVCSGGAAIEGWQLANSPEEPRAETAVRATGRGGKGGRGA